MAKDAKGHGSEKRGTAANVQQAYKNAAKFGPNHPSVGRSLRAAAKSELAALGAHSTGVAAVGQSAPPPIDRAKLNRTYNRNENNNYHSENIALLTKNFGTADEHAKAQEIVAERNKQGGLPTSTKNVPDVRGWQYGIHQKYIGQLTGNANG